MHCMLENRMNCRTRGSILFTNYSTTFGDQHVYVYRKKNRGVSCCIFHSTVMNPVGNVKFPKRRYRQWQLVDSIHLEH